MTIAYVGNFTQSHCTEVHLALTLENLGHTVVRLQEDGYTPEEMGNVLSQLECDLFLFTRTWGKTVTLEHLAHLRERKIPSASYHLDLYVGLSRKYLHEEKTLEQILQTDPFWRTDFVFTPDGDPDSQAVFEANGVHHYYIKPGVYAGECYLTPPKDIFKHEVLFVGGGARPGMPNGYGHPEWGYRNELIAFLYDTYGERFSKFGHPQETIRNADLNRLYANSKVTVGDSVCVGFTHTYYWSDRVYETLGRGGFLIHPYIKGLEEEFKDGEHLVYYEFGNWPQLKEKIDYYLEHDEERERIRRAGHEFVKNHATYNQRLEQMLNIVLPKFTGNVSEHDRNGETPSIKINLGAGSEPTADWVNVDWIKGDGIDVVHNLLQFPWPFASGAADEMLARDVLEHMPLFNAENQSTPIKFIEECHRILQPGGKLFMTMPHHESRNLWIDPTHVRGYDVRSFDYFDPETDLGKAYGYYSQCKFKVAGVRTANDNVEFTMVKL